MLNVIQMAMKKITFATEAETQWKILELLIEGTKFQVIGRRQIIIFK